MDKFFTHQLPVDTSKMANDYDKIQRVVVQANFHYLIIVLKYTRNAGVIRLV